MHPVEIINQQITNFKNAIDSKKTNHVFVVMGTEGDYQPLATIASELELSSNQIIFITPSDMIIQPSYQQVKLNITTTELITLTVDILGNREKLEIAKLWSLMSV